MLLNVAVAVNVEPGAAFDGAPSVSVRAPTLLVTVKLWLRGRFSVAEESPTETVKSPSGSTQPSDDVS